MRILLWPTAILAVGSFATTSFTVLAGRLWAADLLLMFLPHIFTASLLALATALLTRRPFLIALALISVLVGASVLLRPTGHTTAAAAVAPAGKSLRVMTFNVRYLNYRTSRLRGFLETERPDLVLVQEAYPQWHRAFAGWTDLYPYNTLTGNPPWLTVVLLSRYPILASQRRQGTDLIPQNELNQWLLQATVDVDGQPVDIFVAHPPTPRRQSFWTARQDYLGNLAEMIAARAHGRPAIAAGDFNTVPWSPYWARFREVSGLKDADPRSWPAPTRFFREYRLPVWAGVPIDHVMVSPDIDVAAVSIGPYLNSDHLPVVADLRLPPLVSAP